MLLLLLTHEALDSHRKTMRNSKYIYYNYHNPFKTIKTPYIIKLPMRNQTGQNEAERGCYPIQNSTDE